MNRPTESRPYLIIAGTTKAATTSLHGYLACHPELCTSSMKETRFFLDPDYPIPSKYRVEDGLEKYDEFFASCGSQRIRVEATPDYLYSPGTAGRIRELLPGARLLFVLRDPVSRLVSWFRFAKQNGLLPATMTFREYVEPQFGASVGATTLQAMRALEQGRYARYLEVYFEQFGPERLLILFFEDLTSAPQAQLARLAEFAGISPAPFQDAAFGRVNQTVAVRSAGLHTFYVRARFLLRKQTHHHGWIHRPLRFVRRLMEPLYLRLNRGAADMVDVPSDLAARLVEYYRSDVEQVATLARIRPPWETAEVAMAGSRGAANV